MPEKESVLRWHEPPPIYLPLCGLLALIVAGVHLYWGLPRFAVYATVGRHPDPRPLLFVLSGHAILAGLTTVALDRIDWHRMTLPGSLLMGAHLIGYAAWHTVLSHGVRRHPSADHSHVHAADIIVTTVSHLGQSPMVLVSKLSESMLLVLLAIGYWNARREI